MFLKIKKSHLVILNLLLLFQLFLLSILFYVKFTFLQINGQIIPKDNNSCTLSTLSSKYISTCGQSADDLGPGQKVLSYSLYRKNGDFRKYADGIEANILSLGRIYNSDFQKNGTLKPWVIRIYSDLKKPKDLTVKYANVLFWCDVREIMPDGYLKFEKSAWRFLPLGDPTVEIFLSRDLDGILKQREKSAVNEWIMSNYSFHAMRDHPLHNTPILAGMWGANNQILGFETAKKIRQNFIQSRIKNDQAILTKFIWKRYSNQVLVHDSYLCKFFGTKSTRTRPWPSKRDPEWDFVGKPVLRFNDTYIVKKCPIKCRPKEHKDWEYC